MLTFLVAVALVPSAAQAQTTPEAASVEARVLGRTIDAESGEAIPGAYVRLRGAGRSEFTHADGSFHFEGLSAGSYTVDVERIGYSRSEVEVDVGTGETVEVEVALRPSAISLPGMVVTGLGRARRADQAYQPTSVLAGRDLQRNLSWSLASTLLGEPGIAMQTFGPAPAQPVIRGMGSDRVLVLEDGNRMGDLSHTAPDHAVGIDPISADRIEVVRGPAGLLYGSNALGGVVNVIREEVPRSLPQHPTGTLSLQGESVNRGFTTAGVVRIPVRDRFALRAEGTYREGGSIRTPLGDLESTGSRGYNLGFGGSWIPEWGFLGAAVRAYDLHHGVPGEFQGEVIPGGHPGGVDAETSRLVGRIEAGHSAGLGPFSAVELDANLIAYLHQEIEGVIGEGPDARRVVGAEFDQLTGSVNFTGRHEHEPNGLRAEGAIGVSFLWQDVLTAGSFPGSRSATEYKAAAYFYEELDVNFLRFQFGARYDLTWTRPHDKSPIRIGERDRPVENRTFGDFSGSLALLRDFGSGWTVGASVARAYRTPAIPELFSDGPHLADFSFDIGNPQLDTETGLGADVFVRVSRPEIQAEATAFRNRLSNYIYYFPTGEIDPRFRRFPVFEARGDDALFMGADGRVQWEFIPGLVVDATVSYVRATRTLEGDPLPEIPPLNGAAGLRYETSRFFVSGGWRGAEAQDRVPRQIESPIEDGVMITPERPTPGYGLWSAGAGVQWVIGEAVHSVVLQTDNLTNRVWRSHLSRIKDVAPEPGRNVQLLYRVSF